MSFTRRLAALAAVLATGCVFFEAPGPKGRDILLAERKGLGPVPVQGAVLTDLDEVRDAAEPGLDAFVDPTKCDDAPSLPKRGKPEISFLHISDAQIRDESLYGDSPEELLRFDLFVGVSIRRPLVERFDSLVLAAFLHSWGSRPHSFADRRFVVHTGDLLDISVVTELMDGMGAFRSFSRAYDIPLFSVPGNHDGLTFGNITDSNSDTRGLGINHAEFVIAHLLEDPEAGFGYRFNELWQERENGLDETAEQIGEMQDDPALTVSMARPIGYRGAVHYSGLKPANRERLGYYGWRAPIRGAVAVTGARFLVLDTRSQFGHEGNVGWPQFGWLVDQLRAAAREREVVILFSHHGPEEIHGPGGHAFRKLLDRSPHVVAHFYGHGHVNRTMWTKSGQPARLLAQTGSLADYPQAGRTVDLWVEDHARPAVVLRWDFVKARGDSKKPGGILLEAALDVARRDSRKELQIERSFLRDKTNIPIIPWNEIRDATFACDEGMYAGEVSIPIAIPAVADLDPEALLGESRRALIRDKRDKLGLEPGLDTAIDGGEIGQPLRELASFPKPVEASAILAIPGRDTAVVVGDEADNGLWLVGTKAGAARHWLAFADDAKKLNDLEALAPVAADRPLEFFAVTSHSINKKGEEKPARMRIARLRLTDDLAAIRQVDVAEQRDVLTNALRTVLDERSFAALAKARPAEGGLEIEGAAFWRGQLLLGLRSPRDPNGQPIVLSVADPDALFDDEASPNVTAKVLGTAQPGEAIRGMTEDKDSILVILASQDTSELQPRVVRWNPATNAMTDFDTRCESHAETSEKIRCRWTQPEGIAKDGDSIWVVQDVESSAPPGTPWLATVSEH